jgi:hypothetical protein
MEQSVQWRRDKVQELSSKGNSQREIARILQVGIGAINRASSSSSTNPNKIPIAGSNQKVHPSDHVTLDGSKSSDPILSVLYVRVIK